MRIKVIVPFPFDTAGIRNRAAQIPLDALHPGTVVEYVGVKHMCRELESPLESLIFDMYMAEAGLRAEEEGYDAVCVDTVSDSGVDALRSRLSIPVIGPGLAAFHVAGILARKWSILVQWSRWLPIYEKTLTVYGLRNQLASIIALDIPPDTHSLLAGKDEVLAEFERACRHAIAADGAQAIVLGSTTMHQAADYLARTLPVPVINPGPLSIKLAELCVQLKLSHSKAGWPAPLTSADALLQALPAAARPRSH